MEKKRLFAGGVCAIIGGILIVIGAFLGEAFPKILWILAALCQFVNAFTLLRHCRRDARPKAQGNEDQPE